MQRHSWTWLVVTDGANGMHVLNILDEYKHFSEPVKEVADVTGAGDTVMAVIAYGIDKGMDIFDACKLACYAAARIVEKRGVAIIQQDDLERNIVWANGVFDILHTGHLKLLRHAHTLGKRLVVGINSDSSVKRLKGDLRPINGQEKRKEALLELGFVDDVVIFEEDTPYNVIKEIQPDVIVKGGDYTTDTVVGNDIAKVEIFPIIEGYSTTESIEKIRQQQDPRHNQVAFKGHR
jgi:D-beta-D-heptose 7-phosphate kinase/D-beta-D-heptose 1-phosphate adenosyltransferase